jgi:hypothetical protein
MGESRTELIQWLNELLQVNYTKVEQCGSGGAYCQIIDSIYGAYDHHFASNATFHGLHLTFHCYHTIHAPALVIGRRRSTDGSRQDECKARIRICGQFQDSSERLQGKEN